MNQNTVDTLKLRFIIEDDYYEFEADAQHYRLQIVNAFKAFKARTGKPAGQLEVLHDVHGWQLVCIQHCYPIIRNPEALDFDVVALAIYDTIAQVNTWPAPDGAKSTKSQNPEGTKRGHLRIVK